MAGDWLEAIGAFLSGAGAVFGGWWALQHVRKRAEQDCQRRIHELRRAFDHGLEEGLKLKGRDETTG